MIIHLCISVLSSSSLNKGISQSNECFISSNSCNLIVFFYLTSILATNFEFFVQKLGEALM